MRLILLMFLCVCCLSAVHGQKFLQIEKANSLKVKKFYIGDELTFKVRQFPDDWRTEVIEKILVEEDILIFPRGMVHVSDITAVRTFYGRSFGNKVALGLYTFGTGWVFYSLVDALLGGTLTWSVAVVSGTSFALGFIIQRIFRQRTYKMGKRRRLRLLDLNMEKVFGP